MGSEEGIVELLALVLGYHVPDEGIHLKRRGEETKDSKSISSSRCKNYAILPHQMPILLFYHIILQHLIYQMFYNSILYIKIIFTIH